MRLYRRFAFRAVGRSPELLRRGPGRRGRDAPGFGMTTSGITLALAGIVEAFAASAMMPPPPGPVGPPSPAPALSSPAGAPVSRPEGAVVPAAVAPGRAAVWYSERPSASPRGDGRAGRRHHLRRLRDEDAGLRLRPGRLRDLGTRARPCHHLRLRALGGEPPRRHDGAGPGPADRVRRSLLRSPPHAPICRWRVPRRRSIAPRRRWPVTASARSPFGRPSVSGAPPDRGGAGRGPPRR